MTKETIANRIERELNDNYTTDLVSVDSRLKDDLGLDSLDFVELCMFCEKEFDVYIKDEEFRSFETVEELVDLIFNKIENKN